MIINNNVLSSNVNRNLRNNNYKLNKTIEKLSSGYRINKAADDSAGLAISEKMNREIKGLKQASRNIQDAISLIQIADGGMQEIHAILQRINTLSNQAANGIYNIQDREMLQMETRELLSEIDKIANQTNFNGIHLLNQIGDMLPIDLSKVSKVTIYETTNSVESIDVTISDLINGIPWSPSWNPYNEYYEFSADLSSNTITSKALGTGGAEGYNNISAIKVFYEGKEYWADELVEYSGNIWYPFTPDNILGDEISTSPQFIPDGNDTILTVRFHKSNNLILQVGADAGDTYEIQLSDVRTSALGISDLDLTTIEGAKLAMLQIQNAINNISKERSRFGADQNALEHIYNNVQNSDEHLSVAHSRITDADMAQEMTEFTKNQILVQAGTTLLAQANSLPYNLLKLLG